MFQNGFMFQKLDYRNLIMYGFEYSIAKYCHLVRGDQKYEFP